MISSVEVDRGTDKWRHLCKMVREACETYGCFEAIYDKVPRQLREETFSMIKQLFSLPLETKKKNTNPKPYHSYFGGFALVPLYESFRLEDSSNYESVESFTASFGNFFLSLIGWIFTIFICIQIRFKSLHIYINFYMKIISLSILVF